MFCKALAGTTIQAFATLRDGRGVLPRLPRAAEGGAPPPPGGGDRAVHARHALGAPSPPALPRGRRPLGPAEGALGGAVPGPLPGSLRAPALARRLRPPGARPRRAPEARG